MKNKFAKIFGALIITVICFIGLLYVEQNYTNPNGKGVMYLVKKDKIDKNTIITDSNFGDYFEKYKGDKKFCLSGVVTDKKDIVNRKVKVNELIKGQVISKEMFADKNDSIANFKDPVECSFKVDEIGNAVGGIIREGDIINIYSLNKETKQTNITLEKVYVEQAFSSDGAKISQSNDKPATVINVIFEKSDSVKLSDALNSNGIIRIEKDKS